MVYRFRRHRAPFITMMNVMFPKNYDIGSSGMVNAARTWNKISKQQKYFWHYSPFFPFSPTTFQHSVVVFRGIERVEMCFYEIHTWNLMPPFTPGKNICDGNKSWEQKKYFYDLKWCPAWCSMLSHSIHRSFAGCCQQTETKERDGARGLLCLFSLF